MTVNIVKYSHHFTVAGFSPKEEVHAIDYTRGLVSYKVTKQINGDVTSVPDKVFAVRTEGPRTYRYHIEMFDDFVNHLRNFNVPMDITDAPLYEPVEASFTLNPKYKPFDYQEPIIDFVCDDGYKRVVTLQTGLGKTAVFLFSVARIGVRTVLVIPPKYFDRWVDDLSAKRAVDGNDPMIPLKEGSELLIAQGSADLRSLILLAQGGELTAKFILLSAQTYFNYVSEFVKHGVQEKYANMEPINLWKTLGIGLLCVDEGHENFHANFKLDLFANIPKSVTLSATMVPDDPFLKTMYQVMYPDRLRMDAGAHQRYANMLFVPYRLDEQEKPLKTSWKGRTDYSQLAFEKDILHDKNHKRFHNLVNMICYDIDNYFFKLRHEKYKLLIFFDTVDMCVAFEEILANRYPDTLVGKYTADEGYEVLDELEIIIATTKSASTAVDIKNLQMVFSFVARGSTQANLQMFGRLRRLKTSVVKPTYITYFCVDLRPHRNYHKKHLEIFGTRALTINERQTHFVI